MKSNGTGSHTGLVAPVASRDRHLSNPMICITDTTHLSITLHKASKLARADTFGLSDPYTIVNLGAN